MKYDLALISNVPRKVDNMSIFRILPFFSPIVPFDPFPSSSCLNKERHATNLLRGAFVQVGFLLTGTGLTYGQCKKRGNLWNGVMV